MKLIVGLGNPDSEYNETRHNVGWMFLDWLKKKWKVDSGQWIVEKRLNAEVAKTEINGTKAWLLKPLTYVNKSGDAVRKAKPWAKAKNDDIIVAHDDLDIPFGMCKLSFDKNSGGHKGVESIMASLRTKKFHRIRIGTAVRALDKARQQSDKKRDDFVRDFVLHGFTPSQQNELREVFKECETRLHQAMKSK